VTGPGIRRLLRYRDVFARLATVDSAKTAAYRPEVDLFGAIRGEIGAV
jgi:hypothetical protein